MITKEVLESIYPKVKKKLGYCREFVNAGSCKWDCCTYSTSYILLLPGEYESAEALGYDMSCYEIIDPDYNGGMKIVPKIKTCEICVAHEGKCCGYEPLDCVFYPLWPTIEGSKLKAIAGSLCPVISNKCPLDEFIKDYIPVWKQLIQDKDVYSFLEKSKMVGYEEYPFEYGIGCSIEV